MPAARLMVLKFGGSVLQSLQDVHRVVQEIYRWRREGYHVVAVVSAIGDVTNQLSLQAQSFAEDRDPVKQALLLATGELQSAAWLGMALDRAGISSFVCDEQVAGLRTIGEPLDASLSGVDTTGLLDKLQQRGVLVVPGFIGRSECGSMSLLGRGGSDLTALFLAAQLQADRCRLIKDVDGLYEFDPKQSGHPRRFRSIDYDRALTLDESIVQHKAIRFARQAGLNFEVASLFSRHGTQVGPFSESCLQPSADPGKGRLPRLRVALIGLGSVGYGVYHQLTELFGDQFQVVAVAVRHPRKAQALGVPDALIVADAEAAIRGDCDVVVELVGGVTLPDAWARLALQLGKHVVTANKSLLARQAAELETLARQQEVRLLFSAAVGGGLPVLETIESLTPGDPVVEVRGLLNGTSNFVLDQARQGHSFDQAIQLARQAGCAEQDSRHDLEGVDAAEKLVLIAARCGWPMSTAGVKRQVLSAEIVDRFDWDTGRVLRQVTRVSRSAEGCLAAVEVRALPVEHPYASVRGAGNFVVIETCSGDTVLLRGCGAGRWPTTASVMGDLLQLVRQQAGDGPAENSWQASCPSQASDASVKASFVSV